MAVDNHTFSEMVLGAGNCGASATQLEAMFKNHFELIWVLK